MMKLKGRVQKGLRIGRTLGYPTANLEIYGVSVSPTAVGEAEPRDIPTGVYAARATFRGATHNAAVVIGARTEPVPISAEQNFQSGKHGKPLVEVHLLDFNGDLRGEDIAVDLLEKISEIEQCGSERMLIAKIEDDVKKVRAICSRGSSQLRAQ